MSSKQKKTVPLYPLPEWVSCETVERNQEEGLVNLVNDIGSNNKYEALIRKALKGRYSDFDYSDDEYDQYDEGSTLEMIHDLQAVGLEKLAQNATQGRYDHGHIVLKGETHAQKEKAMDQWVRDTLSSWK